MTAFLTVYILIWPAISAAILAMIWQGFVSEFREARAEGKDLV